MVHLYWEPLEAEAATTDTTEMDLITTSKTSFILIFYRSNLFLQFLLMPALEKINISLHFSGGYQGYAEDGTQNQDQFYARSNVDGK